MMEKQKEFLKKLRANKRFVTGAVIFGFIASFGLGHSLSFGSYQRGVAEFENKAVAAQGQVVGRQGGGQRGLNGQAQNSQTPSSNAQDRQTQGLQMQGRQKPDMQGNSNGAKGQSGVDGASGTTKQQ